MKFPTKEEIVQKQWLERYSHFAQRLGERYQLDISFAEYMELNKQPIKTIKLENQNKKIGILLFKGKEILVAKERKRTRHLRTALPYKNLTQY